MARESTRTARPGYRAARGVGACRPQRAKPTGNTRHVSKYLWSKARKNFLNKTLKTNKVKITVNLLVSKSSAPGTQLLLQKAEVEYLNSKRVYLIFVF